MTFPFSFLFSIFLIIYMHLFICFEFKFECMSMRKCTTISSTSNQSLKHTKFHTSSFVSYVNLFCKYYLCWVYILVPEQNFKRFKFLVIFKLVKILGCCGLSAGPASTDFHITSDLLGDAAIVYISYPVDEHVSPVNIFNIYLIKVVSR